MNSLSIHAISLIGHTENCYDFSYFNYNFLFLCAPLRKCYIIITGNMEYSPNFRQMDKAGHIKEKPINY